MIIQIVYCLQVTEEELGEIVHRLQKPTRSTEQTRALLYHSSRATSSPTPCPRAWVDTDDQPGRASKRPVSPRVIQRLVRRLQRPTISTMAADGTVSHEYEPIPVRPQSVPPRTDHREKAMERIRRPTTASRLKLYDSCILCEELDMSPLRHRPPHGGVPAVSEGNMEKIVTRMRTPTHASNGCRVHCRKDAATPMSELLIQQQHRSDLPLVSGLPRSRTVADITNRMYTPTPSRRTLRRAPPATTFCYWYKSQT